MTSRRSSAGPPSRRSRRATIPASRSWRSCSSAPGCFTRSNARSGRKSTDPLSISHRERPFDKRSGGPAQREGEGPAPPIAHHDRTKLISRNQPSPRPSPMGEGDNGIPSMASSSPPVIGVIGGSGLYQIDGLTDVEWRRVDSPFGKPSDALCFGRLDGQQVVFLPRHGRGHPVPPSEINFRANIDALKRCGVTDIISLSAVGSLKQELAPGDFVIVDQFI